MIKKLLFLLSLTGVCLFFIFPNATIYADADTNEIDIETSPHKEFFEITNGRPGDTYTKVLTVQNNGSQDFNYIFSNRFLTGSEKLYNELQLKVTVETDVLYNGKLKDFKKLDPRDIRKHQSEELSISISIPMELGNEFQGLNTEFQFKFYVEGTLGGILPADGPKLPETGSNMFNLLVSGCVLFLIGISLQLFVKFKRRISNQQ